MKQATCDEIDKFFLMLDCDSSDFKKDEIEQLQIAANAFANELNALVNPYKPHFAPIICFTLESMIETLKAQVPETQKMVDSIKSMLCCYSISGKIPNK